MTSMRLISSGLVIAFCLMLVGCGGGPGGSAKAFFKAMDDGEVDTAMKYVNPETPDEVKGKMREALSAGAKKLRDDKEGIKSLSIEQEDVHGDTATLKIKFTYGDDSSDTEEVKMMKIDGKWYLSMDMGR